MAYPFHLSYFGFAVVAGFGIILVDFFRGKNESFEPTFGLLLLLIGIIFELIDISWRFLGVFSSQILGDQRPLPFLSEPSMPMH